MRFRVLTTLFVLGVSMMAAGQSNAQDGMNLGAGQTLKFVQDTATGFGNSSGTQASLGGSEINAVWGDVVGSTLSFSVSGNLEANFNKYFMFFDAVAGGENVLLSDNNDGGFNEINNLAGLTFDNGFTADYGLRLEVGSGFWALNGFNLNNNTAFTVASGGGPGDLPLNNVGSSGVFFGWDNSNALGIDGASAAGALTATTGWEFSIDLNTYLGAITQDIKLAGFITSGDGTFLSNQVIGGLGAGAPNLAGPAGTNFNQFAGNQFVVFSVPEPGTASVLLGGLVMMLARRRRS